MAQARDELQDIVRRYVAELERCEVPVERVILFGSHARGEAGQDSDIDLAVFSEAFGPPRYLEISGVLSRAKWGVAPMIEAIGYHPSELRNVLPTSFLHEILSTGQIIYQREQSDKEDR